MAKWPEGEAIRIFWIGLESGSREAFAEGLRTRLSDVELLIPLILREHSFFDVNAVMGDTVRLMAAHKESIEAAWVPGIEKLTFAIIARRAFTLPQTSSMVPLPMWFPLSAGKEAFFTIQDLGGQTSVAMLNCVEARIDSIAEKVHALECALVNRLQLLSIQELREFVRAAHRNNSADGLKELGQYVNHNNSVVLARGYRPNASQDGKALITKLLRVVLASSPKELAERAKELSAPLGDKNTVRLAPTYFAVMLRPTEALTVVQANWHSILVALYQAYQIMNGAAHAGDYSQYPISLQYEGSADLRRFMDQALDYIVQMP
jgi:hypothetical protein